ncbi:low temperature requirement protein A [Glaciibacter superstes]|uniref:low temperature requirement protein A n=1 Tax=Glaciibacter superstes TaxID=501023 RepID=UPI0003B57525|nr:low temperature requirement protein A [Glaciibacter superstes]
MTSETGPLRRGLRVRMRGRATDEPNRASSELELLFDLTFVVAIASITAQLAHGIANGHTALTIVPFLEVFFAIWWAWMNFTWFASSFDTDDVPYRLLTMLQMGGVLLLAAGVPTAFTDGDFLVVTLGYFVMRVGLVAQWVCAAIEDRNSRRTALRYASGIAVVQLGWLLRLLLQQGGLLPEQFQPVAFAVLVVAELAVPIWAERGARTSWHPHHIAERYGLFVIILLGESVLAASMGVAASLEAGGVSGSLITISIAGLVTLFAVWWIYFLEPMGHGLATNRDKSFLWGYGHYGIFAALAALGAGLEVAVEQTGDHLKVPAMAAGFGVAIPAAIFLLLLWTVQMPIVAKPVIRPVVILPAVVVVAALPLAVSVLGVAGVVAVIAVVCALVVTVTLLTGARAQRTS